MWNFSRYYARTLYTYASEPGQAAREVVPDLAKGQPEVGNDGKTYTVKLKEGLTYEDGSEIVAEDIKFNIARSNFGPDALPGGPKYYKEHLAKSGDYEGPFTDAEDPLEGLGGVETPDDHTLVFHLKEKFVDFPYVLVQPQSSPVPVDTEKPGERYQASPISSGPYKFEDEWTSGDGLALVRNDEWDPESDPIRTALPDRITVEEGVDQNEIDQRLQNGELDVDLAGTGLGPGAKGEAVNDEATKTRLDNPENQAHYFMNVNTKVEPFDDLACRQAVQYAVDRGSVQRAWGGKTGGTKATQVLPPAVPGANAEYNAYPSQDGEGDIDEAEAKLEECGEGGGFSANLAVRSDRPAEVRAGESIKESLERAGIDVTIEQFPTKQFSTSRVGSPDYVQENELGLALHGWMPDWLTGYGYFSQILHGSAIKKASNYNVAEFDNEEFNKTLDQVVKMDDPQVRAEEYEKLDQLVMEEAVLVPMVFHKPVLYRPDNLTNVYFNPSWKMYDYMTLGTTET